MVNTKNETYKTLVKLYGPNLMQTDGLYHIYDSRHMERYIHPEKFYIDKRAKYKTIIVLDDIIVSKVLTDSKLKFVILNKSDLSLLYKIDTCLAYIDNNIVCFVNSGEFVIVSHTGKKLYNDRKVLSICNIHKHYYLIRSKKMFNDNIVAYNQCTDSINVLTIDKKYSIVKLKGNTPKVDVIAMGGGDYIFDFIDKTCVNKFTGQEENQTYLWKFY